MDIGDIKYLEVPAKITKLSEAIRIGAKLRPKCTGQLFKDGGSCAMGAAYEALHGYPGDVGPDEDGSKGLGLLDKIWEKIAHPGIEPIFTIGITKNDRGWSREKIADWLELEGL